MRGSRMSRKPRPARPLQRCFPAFSRACFFNGTNSISAIGLAHSINGESNTQENFQIATDTASRSSRRRTNTLVAGPIS